MTADERKHRIEEYLQQVEFASLEDLSAHVGASTSTVRRDLTLLEAAGALKRTHGGARILAKEDDYVFAEGNTQQLAEKEAIGLACVELIQKSQNVIFDAGSTVFHVARQLKDRAPQVITNSLPVANLLAAENRVELIVTGGLSYPRLGVLVGNMAVEAFKTFHADIAIMSGGGITPEGITNSHSLLIDIQLAMMNAAHKVVFCMDHTKFGRRSVLPLCTLELIDVIVTDHGVSPELVAPIRAQGVEVIVAPPPSAPER